MSIDSRDKTRFPASPELGGKAHTPYHSSFLPTAPEALLHNLMRDKYPRIRGVPACQID